MGDRAALLVESLRSALAGRSDVELALLFGSRARGTEHEESDVDLAVLGPRLDRAALAAELSAHLGIEVDVVPLVDPGVPLLQRLVDASVEKNGGFGTCAVPPGAIAP